MFNSSVKLWHHIRSTLYNTNTLSTHTQGWKLVLCIYNLRVKMSFNMNQLYFWLPNNFVKLHINIRLYLFFGNLLKKSSVKFFHKNSCHYYLLLIKVTIDLKHGSMLVKMLILFYVLFHPCAHIPHTLA